MVSQPCSGVEGTVLSPMHPVDRAATPGSEATPSHKDRRDYAMFGSAGLACDESDGSPHSARRSIGWPRRRRCLARAQAVGLVRRLFPSKLTGAALPCLLYTSDAAD